MTMISELLLVTPFVSGVTLVVFENHGDVIIRFVYDVSSSSVCSNMSK